MTFDPSLFQSRHIGPDDAELQAMLSVVGYDTLDALIDAAVPQGIRIADRLQLPEAATEAEARRSLESLAATTCT